MDKSLSNKLKTTINLLNEINNSTLPFDIDKTLINKDVKDIEYHSSIWRIHFINSNGVIKEECQEYLNENQFAIEYEKTKTHPNKFFFIRTEKGLIRF